MDQENEKGLSEKEVRREVKESQLVLPRYQWKVQNLIGSALSSCLHSPVTPPKGSNLIFMLFMIILKSLLPVSRSSPRICSLLVSFLPVTLPSARCPCALPRLASLILLRPPSAPPATFSPCPSPEEGGPLPLRESTRGPPSRFLIFLAVRMWLSGRGKGGQRLREVGRRTGTVTVAASPPMPAGGKC